MKANVQSVEAHLKERLKDPHFRELYELEEEKAKIASLIVRYRIAHHLSQRRLARKLGLTQQQISKIEQGEFSSLSTIQKVLLALGYHVTLRVIPLGSRLRHSLQSAA
ncbi:MAG: helix-turn-helix transcriptional regulator [Elusimicrobia bacterium]|nr:helix-turn-helix transcriptional regulator [Elusimicrobiota bacterium]